jgi:hypothetical protein
MSLEDPDVIDLVSLSADGKAVALHIVTTDAWPASGERTSLLEAKLKSYVAFAADGQLARQYPEARGRKVLIEIRSVHPLGAMEEKLVEAAREQWCTPENIALVVSAGRGR